LASSWLHEGAKDQHYDSASIGTEDLPAANILFTYPSFAKDAKTRLLILEPGSFEDGLKCRLTGVAHLKEHPYEALSYCWGEKPGRIIESSSGKIIPITANLEAALRRMRHAVDPRLLWVDAICIDQSDVVERSRQVEFMQEIYASAKRVIVWLGEESTRDSLAFNSLQKLKTGIIWRVDLRKMVQLGWYRDKKSGRVFSGGADRSILSDIEYEHLINLLRRDWFRRTWVIQEVASAQDPIVICGSQSIHWEIFAEVYMRLGDHFLPVSQFGGLDAQQSLENIFAIENARRSRSGPLMMPLFQVLVATSLSQCRDARDKIYAVKGLAKDWADKRGLETNYKASVESLFKSFAIADANRNLKLRILSCASGPSKSKHPRIPSWVPDWRRIENAHPFVRYSDRTGFKASLGMAAEAWHSQHGNVFHVKGKWIDSVAVLGSKPTFTKTVAIFEICSAKIEEIRRSVAWLQECEGLASKKGVLTPQRQEELWRTLTCSLTGDGFPAPERYSEYFMKYMKFIPGAADRFSGYLKEAQNSVSGIRGLNEAIPGFDTHTIIEGSIQRWSSKRRFCVTKDGALACVPTVARHGDIICVLFGSEVPYVLRPTRTGFYWVIGECYIHGIMHGESLSYDTEVTEFELV
jgi:hypothetical protein